MFGGPWGKRLLQAGPGELPPSAAVSAPKNKWQSHNYSSIIFADIKQSTPHQHNCITYIIWAQCKITK